MKLNIHPKYQNIKVTCVCGNSFITKSSCQNQIKLDICAKCHPFYTGKQNIIDTENRVEDFNKKFSQFKYIK